MKQYGQGMDWGRRRALDTALMRLFGTADISKIEDRAALEMFLQDVWPRVEEEHGDKPG